MIKKTKKEEREKEREGERERMEDTKDILVNCRLSSWLAKSTGKKGRKKQAYV